MTVILPEKRKGQAKRTSQKLKPKVLVDKDGDADMNDAYNFDDYF